MKITLSTILKSDISQSMNEAIANGGAVNISALAEEIRQRHASENVALEDIESEILAMAQHFGTPIEFDRTASSGVMRYSGGEISVEFSSVFAPQRD
jgi:uncharacterized protein YoaH (UPF0181 family)